MEIGDGAGFGWYIELSVVLDRRIRKIRFPVVQSKGRVGVERSAGKQVVCRKGGCGSAEAGGSVGKRDIAAKCGDF